MKHLFPTVFAVLLGFAAPLAAQNNPVVVELYTSQGCSSCPPADKIIQELAGREDVIALALHVDYWDYIGWKDPFGNPAHAQRQRAYAKAGHRRTIFTPEMIVNGQTDIVGAKAMKLAEAIAKHAAIAPKVKLGLTRDGDQVIITAQALEQINGSMTVHLLRYTPKHTTDIKRGENGGKTFAYANIVEGWTELGEWDGASPLRMTAKMAGDKPCVVIIQAQHTGPILAAARLR
ncbi:MAG: DUF1223 domain-containing protein [Sulfitobacter sp.]